MHQPIVESMKMTDTKCQINKKYLNHSLVKNLPYEFFMDGVNTWDSHQLNLEIKSLGIIKENYRVLVEGERAPFVITHGNTLAL